MDLVPAVSSSSSSSSSGSSSSSSSCSSNSSSPSICSSFLDDVLSLSQLEKRSHRYILVDNPVPSVSVFHLYLPRIFYCFCPGKETNEKLCSKFVQLKRPTFFVGRQKFAAFKCSLKRFKKISAQLYGGGAGGAGDGADDAVQSEHEQLLQKEKHSYCSVARTFCDYMHTCAVKESGDDPNSAIYESYWQQYRSIVINYLEHPSDTDSDSDGESESSEDDYRQFVQGLDMSVDENLRYWKSCMKMYREKLTHNAAKLLRKEKRRRKCMQFDTKQNTKRTKTKQKHTQKQSKCRQQKRRKTTFSENEKHSDSAEKLKTLYSSDSCPDVAVTANADDGMQIISSNSFLSTSTPLSSSSPLLLNCNEVISLRDAPPSPSPPPTPALSAAAAIPLPLDVTAIILDYLREPRYVLIYSTCRCETYDDILTRRNSAYWFASGTGEYYLRRFAARTWRHLLTWLHINHYREYPLVEDSDTELVDDDFKKYESTDWFTCKNSVKYHRPMSAINIRKLTLSSLIRKIIRRCDLLWKYCDDEDCEYGDLGSCQDYNDSEYWSLHLWRALLIYDERFFLHSKNLSNIETVNQKESKQDDDENDIEFNVEYGYDSEDYEEHSIRSTDYYYHHWTFGRNNKIPRELMQDWRQEFPDEAKEFDREENTYRNQEKKR